LAPSGREFLAPRELGIVETAARSELEFGLGRQLFAGPSGIGFGIAIASCEARTDDASWRRT